MKRHIQIDFIHPEIRAIDYFQDLTEAFNKVRENLRSRYRIELDGPIGQVDGRVYFTVDIPDEQSFSNKQLRGIAVYLFRHYPERYRKYCVSNRLFVFRDYRPPVFKENILTPMVVGKRLETAAKFIRLLERTDEEALKKIKQITDILEEKW